MRDYIIFRGQKIKIIENTLALRHKGIKSFEEISKLFENDAEKKNVAAMFLDYSDISDLSGIQSFTNLVILDLTSNKIQDISFLKNLKKLKNLILKRNKVKKIENLDNLINLENLVLSENHITKIENLENLTNLEKLNLSRNQIAKIENLENLVKLERFSLSYNENISKLENLEKLQELRQLELSDNKIKKIENLEKLKNLRTLILEGLLINRIEGLSQLKELKELYFNLYDNPNKLSEIEGLEYLINLETIELDVFNFNEEDFFQYEMIIIYRFPCLIKNQNYESIEDWQEVFIKFPRLFKRFMRKNSKDKVIWYIEQCSKNILNVITKILNDSNYDKIRENQEEDWKEIYNYAKEVFSRKGPKRNILEIVKKELEETNDKEY